jgi:hypothetical protein
MIERYKLSRNEWSNSSSRINFIPLDLRDDNDQKFKDLEQFNSDEYELNALDKHFLQAFNDMPDTAGSGESKLNQISTAIQNHETDLTGFITELLQNALDYNSSKIKITVNEDSIILEHNGQSPTPQGLPFIFTEVSGLTGIHSTQKNADPRFVGTFGLGFKYWTQFFNDCEITGYFANGGVTETTSLYFEKSFHPAKVELSGSKTTQKMDYNSKFKFGGYLKGEIDASDSILNDRFTKSMSVLPRESEFRLEIITNENTLVYDAVTKPLKLQNFDDYELQLVDVKEAAGKITRFVNANSTIGKLSDKFFSKDESKEFYEMAVNYVSSLGSGVILNKIGGEQKYLEYLKEAGVKISLPLDETPSLGYCSSLFITPNTRLPIPGIFDSVWRLNPDRRSLDVKEDKNLALEWNQKISHLTGRMYDLFLMGIINSQEEFNLPNNLLFNYLNPEFISGPNWANGWNNDPSILKLLQFDLNSVGINGNRRPTNELLQLWKYALEELDKAIELDESNYIASATATLTWLSGALDPNVAHIVLPSKIKLPVSVSNFHWGIAEGPEICKNLADGIPTIFLEDVRNEDATTAEPQKEWAKCFDYVVEDSFGNLKFSKETTVREILNIDSGEYNDLVEEFNQLSQIHGSISPSFSLANQSKQVRWVYPKKANFSRDSKYLTDKFVQPSAWLVRKFRQLHNCSITIPDMNISSLKVRLDKLLTNSSSIGNRIIPFFTDGKQGFDVLILPKEGAVWGINVNPPRYLSLGLSDLNRNKLNYTDDNKNAEFGYLKWGEKERIGIVDLDEKIRKLLLNYEQISLEEPMVWKSLISLNQLRNNQKAKLWTEKTKKINLLSLDASSLPSDESIFKRILPIFVDAIGTKSPVYSKPYLHLEESFRHNPDRQVNDAIVNQPHKKVVEMPFINDISIEKEMIYSSIIGIPSKFDLDSNPKKIIDFSAPNGIPKIHGLSYGMSSFSIIRATGLYSFLSEKIGTIKESEPKERIRMLNKLSKFSSETPHKSESIGKLLNYRRSWDIFLYKINSGYDENEKVSITAKLIPRPGTVDNTYVGEDMLPRDTGSEHYNEFRDVGLIHFQRQAHIFPNQVEKRSRLSELLDDAPWLPYNANLSELLDGVKLLDSNDILMVPFYDINQLKNILNPTSGGYEPKDKLRGGLSKLVEVIDKSHQDGTDDLVNGAMLILEHLFESGLSTGKWLKSIEGGRPRINIFYLKQAFENLGNKGEYPNLTNELTVSLEGEWSDFTQLALQSKFDIANHLKVSLPKLVLNDKYWIVSENQFVSIEELISKGEKYRVLNLELFTDERIPEGLISVPSEFEILAVPKGKNLRGNTGKKFLDNVIDSLKKAKVAHLDIVSEAMAIPKKISKSDTGIVPKYFDGIVKKHPIVNIFDVEDISSGKPTAGELIPRVKLDGEELTWVNPIITPNSRDEHLWVSRIIKSLLQKLGIMLSDDESRSTGLVLDMPDYPDEQSKFHAEFIPEIGELKDLIGKFENLDAQKTSPDRVQKCEQLLDELRGAHLSPDQTILRSSRKLLSELEDDYFLYEEMSGLDMNQLSSRGTMSKQVQISLPGNKQQWMLKHLKVKDASEMPSDIFTISAGCVLVCNEIEVTYLRLMHDGTKAAANFSPGILVLLRESIKKQWWSKCGFIEVEGALLQEDEESEFCDIRLHRWHAALIWGFLAAVIESD